MPLLTSLLILIVSARLLGGLFARYKQPAIVGEMLAGIVLGPAMLNIVQTTPALRGIADLAMFLVVASAGLEMHLKDVLRTMSGKGLLIAFLGFAVPVAAGIGIGRLFHLDLMRTVFLGLCISITALPVAVRILESFKMLHTDIARYCVVTAIVNDVAALLALGVILGLPDSGATVAIVGKSLLITGGKLVVFAALVWGFGALLMMLERKGIAVHRFPERLVALFGNAALFGIVIILVLVFASVSEMLGFHFVIGAFFGALLINKDLFIASRYAELERTMASVSGGFLAPLFFAYLGLEFNLASMGSPWFIGTVLLVSILTKIFAGWLGGTLIRLPQTEAWGIGIILNGRGIMELVIANIAFVHNFIGRGFFSTLVLMGVVTTLLAPILFKKFIQPRLAPPPQPDSHRRGVIILGTDFLAEMLGKRLIRDGETVTFIGRDDLRLGKLQEAGFRVISGAPDQQSTLREAGAEQAQSFVALSNDPEVVLRVCHDARQVFRIPSVVARAEAAEQVRNLQAAGIQVVQPAMAMAMALEGALHFPAALTLLTEGNSEFDLADVLLANSRLADTPLRELHLPGQALVLGIRRQGDAEVVVPNGDTILRSGDILMLCGNTTALAAASKWIAEG